MIYFLSFLWKLYMIFLIIPESWYIDKLHSGLCLKLSRWIVNWWNVNNFAIGWNVVNKKWLCNWFLVCFPSVLLAKPEPQCTYSSSWFLPICMIDQMGICFIHRHRFQVNPIKPQMLSVCLRTEHSGSYGT